MDPLKSGSILFIRHNSPIADLPAGERFDPPIDENNLRPRRPPCQIFAKRAARERDHTRAIALAYVRPRKFYRNDREEAARFHARLEISLLEYELRRPRNGDRKAIVWNGSGIVRDAAIGNADPVVTQIIAALYATPLPKKAVSALPQSSPDARRVRALLASVVNGTGSTTGAREFAALHARLGPPLDVTLTSEDRSPAATTFSYRVTFAADVLQYDITIGASGKLDDAAVERWYDR